MHALAFAAKRAYLRTVELGKFIFGPHGLTPARFDLLYIVDRGLAPQGHPQIAIARQLGCSDANVSRMLASLEELGLVTRVRDLMDRRRNLVRLTQEGFRVIRQAAEQVLHTWLLQHLYEEAMIPPPPILTPREQILVELAKLSPHVQAPPPAPPPPRRIPRRLNILRKCLVTIAKGFGDTSFLKYPLYNRDNPAPNPGWPDS
jgi:DNA-binding MarR family transcriptional regulator